MGMVIKGLGNSHIWFSSDYHFSHYNIIKYCNRPFKEIEEMNNIIISRHNKLVKKNDIVICLGDISFNNSLDYIRQMNGTFVLVRGNHDDKASKQVSLNKLTIKYGKYKLLCVHRPSKIIGEYTLNIVGHVHDKWKFDRNKNALNVGVDVWNFKPVPLETVLSFCKEKL